MERRIPAFAAQRGSILKFPHPQSSEHETSADFQKRVDKAMLTRLDEIIKKMKQDEVSKWTDPDFGYDEDDETRGAEAIYRGGTRKNPAMPDPSALRWDRPTYKGGDDVMGAGAVATGEGDEGEGGEDDDEYGDEYDDEYGDEYGGGSQELCEEGSLWVDGAGSADVIQGKLGDCWLLGALATLATRDELLSKVFWDPREANPLKPFETMEGVKSAKGLYGERFKEYGIFVCRFMKDFVWNYVIIDDRIPVFDSDAKPPRVVFAKSQDPNELWVMMIEKAYAKLHKSYDSLIGGCVERERGERGEREKERECHKSYVGCVRGQGQGWGGMSGRGTGGYVGAWMGGLVTK